MQLSLAQTQKSYFETKLALERVAAENQALLQEKEKLQREREELGKQLRRTREEKQHVEERWRQLNQLHRSRECSIKHNIYRYYLSSALRNS